MTTVPTIEIARLAYGAGIHDRGRLIEATARALAESSGRLEAVSPNGCCAGLWQIHRVHGYDRGRLLRDGAYNAEAMFAVSSGGTNWRPWVESDALTAGRRPEATRAVDDMIREHPGGIVGLGLDVFDNMPGAGIIAGAANTVASGADLVALLTRWSTWARILEIVLGLGAVGLGLLYLSRDLAGDIAGAI